MPSPSTTTARLDLPLMQAGQAMKHITHNEALARLDALTHLHVLSDSTALPGDAQAGDSYILTEKDGMQEDGTQEDGKLATFDGTRWERLAPPAGMTAYVADRGVLVVFTGTTWEDAGGAGSRPFPGSADVLGVNTTADTHNRLSVRADATLLTTETGSHRVAVNRADGTDTASVVFQTGFSGGAEFGLLGEEGFALKVSADGTDFADALKVAPDGRVSFPRGLGSDQWPEPEDTEIMGAPNLATVAVGRDTLGLDADRLYLSALFVDRPIALLGANLAMDRASTTTGALLRAGLYKLGAPADAEDEWSAGERVVDYGARPADAAGHKRFDLPAPLELARGWYLHVVGVSGEGSRALAGRWSTPGASRYTAFGSGTGADIRVTGVSRYLVGNHYGAEIANGLPATFADSFKQVMSIHPYALQPLLPIWRGI